MGSRTISLNHQDSHDQTFFSNLRGNYLMVFAWQERERWGQEKIKHRLNKKIENNIFPLVGWNSNWILIFLSFAYSSFSKKIIKIKLWFSSLVKSLSQAFTLAKKWKWLRLIKLHKHVFSAKLGNILNVMRIPWTCMHK